MAIGDAAAAAGYPLVPDEGPDGTGGKVREGFQEINRTRDFLAALKMLIPGTKSGFRASAGISSGTAEPVGGLDGDIYFKILP
ncbi:MAG TPA: hypothetical protein VJQ25_07660 [Nitrospira sp.]|nr:hypothetical protein [Nitrospira sp.]